MTVCATLLAACGGANSSAGVRATFTNLMGTNSDADLSDYSTTPTGGYEGAIPPHAGLVDTVLTATESKQSGTRKITLWFGGSPSPGRSLTVYRSGSANTDPNGVTLQFETADPTNTIFLNWMASGGGRFTIDSGDGGEHFKFTASLPMVANIGTPQLPTGTFTMNMSGDIDGGLLQ